MEERIQKLCLADTRTEARRMHRNFMVPEYGSTSRKDAIISSSKSVVIGPNFESSNF